MLYNISMNKSFKIDDEYAILTKETLHDEYVVNGLCDSQIAKKYNVGSKTTVWRRRKFFGIENKNPLKSNQNACVNRTVIIDINDATRMLTEGKTHQEIASIMGVSRISVFRRLQELGLTTKQGQSQHKLRWHTELSDTQVKFILGTTLGDGSITKGGVFVCNHSEKQKTYIEHKMEIMESILPPEYELKPMFPTASSGGKTYPSLHLCTQQNEKIRELYTVFYPEGHKIFPYDFLINSSFDASSLAYWYMDDGHRREKTLELGTYGYGFAGNAKILAFLKEKFNLTGTLRTDSNLKDARSPDAVNYISFSKDESETFFTIVGPYVSYGLEYKVPSEYRIKLSNKEDSDLFSV